MNPAAPEEQKTSIGAEQHMQQQLNETGCTAEDRAQLVQNLEVNNLRASKLRYDSCIVIKVMPGD